MTFVVVILGDVDRLLRACDRRSATGRRDYAVLLLLARLGLRASEVAHMSLDDIDWEVGELIVRGKGRRHDRLPIPRDVGNALVEYLRRDRPRCSSRRVFICSQAPRRGFAGPVAISTIVRRAIERAGLQTPTKGAHLLRHSLAKVYNTRRLHSALGYLAPVQFEEQHARDLVQFPA